jgi:hypothetical protein
MADLSNLGVLGGSQQPMSGNDYSSAALQQAIAEIERQFSIAHGALAAIGLALDQLKRAAPNGTSPAHTIKVTTQNLVPAAANNMLPPDAVDYAMGLALGAGPVPEKRSNHRSKVDMTGYLGPSVDLSKG